MERKLTKIDCGELEFQLGYYTHLTAKTIGKGSNGCEIALIDTFPNGNSHCDFVLDLYFDANGFSLLNTHEIRNNINIEIITNITKAIEDANSLLGDKII